MAPGVAQPLEHDLQYMLAEQTAPTEIGANFKAGIEVRADELRTAALVDPCERAQIDSHRVILARDAGLQIGDFQQRILRTISVQSARQVSRRKLTPASACT